MSKFLFGMIGFMFAGPLGAIAGVYLGHALDKNNPKKSGMNARAMFQINMLAILSYVAKVDGHVDPKEVDTIVRVFRGMGYPSHQMAILQRTLQFSLQQHIDLKETCLNFKRATRYEERLILLKIVYMVVMADQVVHANERVAVDQIVQYLEIDLRDKQSIEAEFLQTDDQYYQILGLKRGAMKTEVKKAYRKLSLIHHPDRVAHLGEEYKKVSTEKFQKISEAYEKVMNELKLSTVK